LNPNTTEKIFENKVRIKQSQLNKINMKKHIYFFTSAFFVALLSVFTSCKEESKSAAPVVSYSDITGLGTKSTDGDTIKFTLSPGTKKGNVTFDYTVSADGTIKTVYYMKNNISTQIDAANGQKTYSAKVQDTLSPNLYMYRTEVKDLEGNISSQTAYVRVIGVPIYRKPIYDPATFSGTYPDNMKVVTIGTTKFLRVVYMGWENKFWFPMADTFNIDKTGWTSWRCKVKFALGKNSIDNGWLMENVRTYTRLNDDLTPGATWSEAIQRKPSSSPKPNYFPAPNGSFQEIGSTLIGMEDGATSQMNTINYLNFYAVQQVPWGPITGDTLWVSKIESYDPNDLK
jgi:hypothetical protein